MLNIGGGKMPAVDRMRRSRPRALDSPPSNDPSTSISPSAGDSGATYSSVSGGNGLCKRWSSDGTKPGRDLTRNQQKLQEPASELRTIEATEGGQVLCRRGLSWRGVLMIGDV